MSPRQTDASKPDADRELPWRAVGVDRVRETNGCLEIQSCRAMDGWVVSRYRPTLVHYDGRAWRLVAATELEAEESPHRICYRLEPADADDSAARWGTVATYDASFVEQRELAHRTSVRNSVLWYIAAPLQPLLGFLPSSVKLRMHRTLGIHPLSCTKGSVFMEFLFLLCVTILFAIQLFTGGGAFMLSGGVLVAALLATIDMVVRYSRILSGGMEQYGAFEWLVRRFR